MPNYLTYCGLYCGACCSLVCKEKLDGVESAVEMHTEPGEEPCNGCDPGEHNGCEFAVCNREHGSQTCAFCPEFPCAKIEKFSVDEWEHHKCVLKNHARMREIGVDKWLEEQEKFWQCSACGCRVQWYQETCSRCGASVAEKSQWSL